MTTPIQDAELFLINTIFDLYLLILMIRFILCWARSNYFNPITRFIINCTQPIVAPLRRILPTYHGIEFATLAWILIFATLKFFLVGLVIFGLPKVPIGLIVLALATALKLLLNTFFYAIFLQAILSWIQPGYSPLGELLSQVTSPIMRPIRRLVPAVGGIDISPIPALIILQLLLIVLVNPMMAQAMGLTFG
ncbi:MAG: YggT family protein [Gammaproteobacteria bacterium]